tara:strand:+ start:3901 stop:4206 length:306 start_codon:yes stop_codon:yes gene_type:complete
MQQLPVPIIELIELMLYLGSITYLLGAVFQGVVLYRNKKSFLIRFIVIFLTRILTIIFTFFIWALGLVPVDEMFLFLFLPALIPELVFSPLMLVLFGNKLR